MRTSNTASSLDAPASSLANLADARLQLERLGTAVEELDREVHVHDRA